MKLSKYGQKLEDAGFEIRFKPDYMDQGPEDSIEEKEYIERISDQIDQGNEAAWFIADISLSYEGIDSDNQYMIGCSYDSFDEFTGQDVDCFDYMLKEAYDSIKEKIEKAKKIELPVI